MYDGMKEFLQSKLKEDAENEMKKVQADPEIKDQKAPEGLKQKLLERFDQEESEKANERTEEEKVLIELGRTYLRRRKKRKYLVVAAAAVLVMALGVTAVGGPQKLVESFRRKMMGRSQEGVDVDSENIAPVGLIDEEVGYQKIKDEWGVDVVRMNYYPEKIVFDEFELNETLKTAQFWYIKENKLKILYQILYMHGTNSHGQDAEDFLLQEYNMEFAETVITVKEYEIKDRKKSRWQVQFSYQNMEYFMWIEDETRETVEEIVNNLVFF